MSPDNQEEMLTACAQHTCPVCWSDSPGDSPSPVTHTGVAHGHLEQAHSIHGIHLVFGQDHDGPEATEPLPASSGWEIMHSCFPNCLPTAPKLGADLGRCCSDVCNKIKSNNPSDPQCPIWPLLYVPAPLPRDTHSPSEPQVLLQIH